MSSARGTPEDPFSKYLNDLRRQISAKGKKIDRLREENAFIESRYASNFVRNDQNILLHNHNSYSQKKDVGGQSDRKMASNGRATLSIGTTCLNNSSSMILTPRNTSKQVSFPDDDLQRESPMTQSMAKLISKGVQGTKASEVRSKLNLQDICNISVRKNEVREANLARNHRHLSPTRSVLKVGLSDAKEPKILYRRSIFGD